MATLLWFCGCEAGGPVPNDNTGAGNEFSSFSNGGGGSPSVVTTTPRTGTYCLSVPTLGIARLRISNASSTTRFIRFAFKASSNPSSPVIIFGSNSSSNSPTARGFHVWLNTNGTLGWAFDLGESGPVASGSDPILLGQWNLIEVKMVRDAAVGGMEIKLNEVVQVSSFATSTTTNTSLTVATFYWGNDIFQATSSGETFFFDDFAYATDAYPGDGGCVAIQGKAGAPTYDAWTKNGDTTAAACWSQTPWDSAKNCTDAVVADRQTMLLDDSAVATGIASGSVINGAMLLCVAKIVTSGNFKLTHRISGVDTDSATKALSTTDTMEPNGVNGDSMDVFTPSYSDLTSGTMEIGAVANSTNQVTVEDMWLMVDFTPPTPPGTGSVGITGYAPTVDNPGGATTTNITPSAGALVLTGPQFVRVLEIGPLIVQWNDLLSLSVPLPVDWDVVSPGAVGTLPVTWDVLDTLLSLPVTWRVVPNLQPLFSADIQQPTTVVVEIT